MRHGFVSRGIAAKVSGVDCDYWDFASLATELDYYTPVILANNDFLQESPEIAKAFLAATAKGYTYAAEHPKEAADMLIAGDTTGSLKDARELVVASQEWISTQYLADAATWGRFDVDRWNGFYNWLFSNGLTTKDLTGSGFSNDYLPEE